MKGFLFYMKVVTIILNMVFKAVQILLNIQYIDTIII